MAEPSTTTVGIAIGLGTVTLTGSIFGVQYDALLAGFFGGLISLSFMPALTRWKIAWSMATSSILAGYFAPVGAAAALNYFGWLSAVGDLTRLACAVAIGFSWQALLPAVIRRMRSFLDPDGQIKGGRT